MNHLLKSVCVAFLLLTAYGLADDEMPIAPAKASVWVKFQYRTSNSSSGWLSSSITLQGATTESMMRNQIAARHPGCQVRITGARLNNKSTSAHVQYQYAKPGSTSWATSSITLYDVLNQSMAQNQLLASHPGMEVRILSMQ